MLVLRLGSRHYKMGMSLNITERAFMPVTSTEFVTLQRNACRDNTCSPWWDSYLEWLQLRFFFFFCYAVLKEELDMTEQLNWTDWRRGGEVRLGFVVVLGTKSCPTLCDPMDWSLPGSFCPWDFPGKNTGVGCHFLIHMEKAISFYQCG